MTLKVDKFGRILIPKVLRQAISIEPGDKVSIQIDGSNRQFSIRKARTLDDAVLSTTSWGFPTVSLSLPQKVDFNVSDYVHSVRQDYLDRKFGLK